LGRREGDFGKAGARGTIVGKKVGLVRVEQPIAYLDVDHTGLVEAD